MASVFLAGCGGAPAPVASRDSGAAAESRDRQTVDRMMALNREADALFRSGRSDEAAALVLEAQPIISRALSTPRPGLRAMEAASDLDDLYGRMLVSSRHYGAARLLFQKNVARWRHWPEQTAETARRRKLAESAIAECDRHLAR